MHFSANQSTKQYHYMSFFYHIKRSNLHLFARFFDASNNADAYRL